MNKFFRKYAQASLIERAKRLYRSYGSRTGDVRDPDMNRSWADDMRAITSSLQVPDPQSYSKSGWFPSGLGFSFGPGDYKCNGYASEVYTKALGADFWHDPETNRMRNVNTMHSLISQGKYSNPNYRLVTLSPEEARYTPGVMALEPGVNGRAGHVSIMGDDGIYMSASSEAGVRPHPKGRAAAHREGTIYVVPVRNNISDEVFRQQHRELMDARRAQWGAEYQEIDKKRAADKAAEERLRRDQAEQYAASVDPNNVVGVGLQRAGRVL